MENNEMIGYVHKVEQVEGALQLTITVSLPVCPFRPEIKQCDLEYEWAKKSMSEYENRMKKYTRERGIVSALHIDPVILRQDIIEID